MIVEIPGVCKQKNPKPLSAPDFHILKNLMQFIERPKARAHRFPDRSALLMLAVT